MNRQEKIKLLKAIRAGLLKPEDLIIQPISVFFSRITMKDGSFEKEGKVYSAKEHEDYITEIEQKNYRRRMAGLPEERVITVIYKSDERNAPILD